MATIFTKIINREIPANIVFENEYVLAFKDINPAAPIHILVVPKKEIKTLNDICEEDAIYLNNIFFAIKSIAKEQNFDEEGYRVINNCNKFGGQEVYHLHFHILAGEEIGPLRANVWLI